MGFLIYCLEDLLVNSLGNFFLSLQVVENLKERKQISRVLDAIKHEATSEREKRELLFWTHCGALIQDLSDSFNFFKQSLHFCNSYYYWRYNQANAYKT